MAHAIDMLSPDHRVTHYRAMASEVQYLASEAQFDEVREQFLELAKSWLNMADTMERNMIERELLPGPVASNWLKVA
jgi:hypothetical protein